VRIGWHRPVAPLWPVAAPPESMVLDVPAARKELVEELRKAPKASAPADLQSYVGSPVPALGLSVPTMRAIVAAFAKDHRDLSAAAVNALARTHSTDSSGRANSIGRSSSWRNFCTMRNSGSSVRSEHGSASAGSKIDGAPRPSSGSTRAVCHGSSSPWQRSAHRNPSETNSVE